MFSNHLTTQTSCCSTCLHRWSQMILEVKMLDIKVLAGYEGCWMNCQILWNTFGDGLNKLSIHSNFNVKLVAFVVTETNKQKKKNIQAIGKKISHISGVVLFFLTFVGTAQGFKLGIFSASVLTPFSDMASQSND